MQHLPEQDPNPPRSPVQEPPIPQPIPPQPEPDEGNGDDGDNDNDNGRAALYAR
jgi:hypothetical protein